MASECRRLVGNRQIVETCDRTARNRQIPLGMMDEDLDGKICLATHFRKSHVIVVPNKFFQIQDVVPTIVLKTSCFLISSYCFYCDVDRSLSHYSVAQKTRKISIFV